MKVVVTIAIIPDDLDFDSERNERFNQSFIFDDYLMNWTQVPRDMIGKQLEFITNNVRKKAQEYMFEVMGV